MNFYCKFHPDFEGVNIGKLHDHLAKDHAEVTIAELPSFIKENIEQDEVRRSDSRMVVRTWGRPPKMGQWVTDSEIEKK